MSIDKLKELIGEFPENGVDCDERQRMIMLVESVNKLYNRAVEVSTLPCSQDKRNQVWDEVDRMEVRIAEIEQLRRTVSIVYYESV